MAIGEIRSAGFWSMISEDDSIDYYITTEQNEEILILDENNEQTRELNSITFYSFDSTIKIKINNNKKVLTILSGMVVEYTYQKVIKFKILAPAGTKILAYGQYY